MDRQEFEALIVKINMFAAGLEKLEGRLVDQFDQATQRITQTATSLASAADQSAALGSERLEQNASRVIAAGANSAVNDLLHRMGQAVGGLESALRNLQQRAAMIDRVHVATAWKAFIGLALSGVVIIGVAAYFAWDARQILQQAKWVRQVNAAEAAGKLAPCPDAQGICALIGKKWVRLDQT
ncbi:hypothetical protein [Dyella psychrodurans]|uniref:Uncharacterized protein n=1 Tax=Dyella psychrodurans TaxID=1927960 RepID=A0A370WX47_9GAMM|nr:hypothetical protein [Dyella psychrodurans]RDS80709.1 hypothetical protein DWU99_19220 [Dyella psychrodurans]